MTRLLPCAFWLALLMPGIAGAAFQAPPFAEQQAVAEAEIPKLLPESLPHLNSVEQKALEQKTSDQKKVDPKPGTEGEAIPAPRRLETEQAAAYCDPCFFFDTDFLVWWVRRGPATALLTTGPDNGTGLIGDPTTRVLFGQGGIGYDTFAGLRITTGWNFGCDRFWGVEASGFVLEQRMAHFSASSDALGNPLLVRPFLSVDTTEESGVAVSNPISPGKVRGFVNIDSHTHFWGYDVNVVAHSVREANKRFDLIVGYRGLALDEDLNIQEDLTLLEGGASIFQRSPVGLTSSVITPSAGSTISVVDQFAARNRFYGGQIGGRYQWLWNCWTLDLTAKVALGITHEEIKIGGISKLNDPDPSVGTVVTPGGVLALAGQPGTNSGAFNRDRFAVVPEMTLQTHYDFNCHFRVSLGYNGVYWSAVARPGDQIDRDVNPKLVPTGSVAGDFNPKTEQTRPTLLFRDNGFWAHGISLGLEFRY